jgi:hypothetical protein
LIIFIIWSLETSSIKAANVASKKTPRSEIASGRQYCFGNVSPASAPALDDAAAQADVAVVQHGRLARRDGPLRLVEGQRKAAAIAKPQGTSAWR